MAIRKSECHDCEFVFLKKGNKSCPECGSTNVGPYSRSVEFESELDENYHDQLDEFELKDFHSRARNSR